MAENEVTPEVLRAATHTVWIETDLSTGSGLDQEIAPDIFTLWHNHVEYVHFNDIVGLAGGNEAVLPLLPQQVAAAEYAAKEDPGECIFVEPLKPDENAEQLWQTFFANQLRKIGQIAVRGMQDLLQHTPIFPQNTEDVLYAASVITPTIEPINIGGEYMNFDVFSYLGIDYPHTTRRLAASAMRHAINEHTNDLHFIHAIIEPLKELFGHHALR